MMASNVSVATNPRHNDRSTCFLRARRIDQIQTPIAISEKTMMAMSKSAIDVRFESDVTLACRIG